MRRDKSIGQDKTESRRVYKKDARRRTEQVFPKILQFIALYFVRRHGKKQALIHDDDTYGGGDEHNGTEKKAQQALIRHGGENER